VAAVRLVSLSLPISVFRLMLIARESFCNVMVWLRVSESVCV
jgi:hypothetical protein